MKFFFIFLFLLGGGLNNVLKAVSLQVSSDIKHRITVVDKDGETIPYIHAVFSENDRYVLSNEEGVLSFSEEKLKTLKKAMQWEVGEIPYIYAPFEKEWWEKQTMPGINKEKLFRDLHTNGRDLYQQAEENGMKLLSRHKECDYKEEDRMRYRNMRNIIYPYIYDEQFK